MRLTIPTQIEAAVKPAFDRALRTADKDARRAQLLVAGVLEVGVSLDPFSEQAKEFAKEAQAIFADFADERGVWGDPFKDERAHAYIFVKRWLPEKYWAPIGTSAATPNDYDAAYKAKYLR